MIIYQINNKLVFITLSVLDVIVISKSKVGILTNVIFVTKNSKYLPISPEKAKHVQFFIIA